jgi:hypothetical protein
MHFSNEFAIVMARSEPSFMTEANTSALNLSIKNEPVAIVQMSPQSAKDLFVSLKNQIEIYERNWGQIKTDYTERLEKTGQ